MGGKEIVGAVLKGVVECTMSRLGALSDEIGGCVVDAGSDSARFLLEEVVYECVISYCCSTGFDAIGSVLLWDCPPCVGRRCFGITEGMALGSVLTA